MSYLETDCTFTVGGRTFEAGGAVVTPAYAIGYPAGDGHTLNDWHGRPIGICRFKSQIRHDLYQIEATIDGVTYTGRGGGVNMLWRGKRKAGQPMS